MKDNNSFFNKSTIIYTMVCIFIITVIGCVFLAVENVNNSKIIKSVNNEQTEENIDKMYQSKEISNKEYSYEIFGLINLNTAQKDELMLLPGIGNLKAEAIIEYRKIRLFEKIEDILKVDGISEKTFEKIKNSICID